MPYLNGDNREKLLRRLRLLEIAREVTGLITLNKVTGGRSSLVANSAEWGRHTTNHIHAAALVYSAKTKTINKKRKPS